MELDWRRHIFVWKEELVLESCGTLDNNDLL